MPQQVQKIEAQEQLPLFQGKTTSIILPSTRVVKIRETNGEDDDLISSYNASADGSNVYNFLAAITLHDNVINRKPLPEDIKKWPINDKYYLLFKQRLFVYGPDLNFVSICNNILPNGEECRKENKYFEDLSQWDDNLEDPKNNNPVAIKRYPLGLNHEVELSIASGKKFKYSILTGELESIALELQDATKNGPLLIRELKVENKGTWVPIKHFAGLSSRELNPIRANMKQNDKQFDPMVNFVCGNPKCKKEYSVSLFTIGAFFFPEETI